MTPWRSQLLSRRGATYPLHKPTFFQAGWASGKSRGWIQPEFRCARPSLGEEEANVSQKQS